MCGLVVHGGHERGLKGAGERAVDWKVKQEPGLNQRRYDEDIFKAIAHKGVNVQRIIKVECKQL